MITFTGHGRLSRDVQLRTTRAGKTVATIAVACDRRDRSAEPVYLDLVVWEAQAKAAAEHLIKGQVVGISGRLEPRQYVTSSGDQRVALDKRRDMRAATPAAPPDQLSRLPESPALQCSARSDSSVPRAALSRWVCSGNARWGSAGSWLRAYGW
jgi:hypothetical protein